MDVKQYAEELLKEAGADVDDATRQAFLKVISGEKVSKKLSETVLMHQDYARQSDALRKEKETLDGLKTRNEQWYAKEVANFNATEALRQKYEAALNAGEIDQNNSNMVGGPGVEYLTKKENEERLQREANNMFTIMEWISQKPIQYYQETGKILDVSAVKKLAIEKGISLDQAYNEMTAPIYKEKQESEMAKQLKEAEEKGAREALSKHHLPIDSKPREQSPFFSRPDPATLPPAGPLRETKLREGFVEEFEKTMATSGGS